MQIPILRGIYSDANADFRVAYPRNMLPIPSDQGISAGYLRPAPGVVEVGAGPGIDRGGINWKGACYRVMGGFLVRVAADGSTTTLGDVAGSDPVRFDYSFDKLAVVGGGELYYWDGSFQRVTDPDLGTALSMIWVDGYFMLTDGTSIIVTELNDPAQIDPLKYGSSEVDPDPVVALLKLRDEPHAVNRYTIEVFNNIGGTGFPFQRNDGAQMQRGSVGTHTCCLFTSGNADVVAFVGGGRNEPCAVWLGANSVTTKISTREIDLILQEYTEDQLAASILESRIDKSHQYLMLHLPDQTLVYDAGASDALQQSVWFVLTSSIVGKGQYRAQNHVWCYDKWIVGDPQQARLGTLTDSISTHYGSTIGWEFGTQIIYNASKGAQFHTLELVVLPGRVTLGADPIVWTSYSLDGVTWSQEKMCPAGKQGDRLRRINWQRQGDMRNWRIQKFRGTSDAFISFARLEAELEALSA